MYRVFIKALCVVLLVFTCIGCGGSDGVQLARAGGTVTLQDAPVSGASVTFIPAKGPIAVGTTNDQGKFTLTTGGKDGAPVGNCRVSVTLAAATDDLSSLSKEEQTRELTKKMGAAQGDYGKEEKKSLVPEKYSKADTSGLSFEVSTDDSKNDFKIALQQ